MDFELFCLGGRTIRTIVAITKQNNWSLIHMNVKTTSLHCNLKEDVSIFQPEDFIEALYGLRQARRARYDKIDSWLQNQGFVKSYADGNLYLQLETEEEEVNPTLYRRQVENLIQLSHTCYNISLVVGICSRFVQRPLTSHLGGMKCIWRYLRGTKDYEILLINTLLADLGVKQQIPTISFYNNKSAMKLAHNPIFHQRTKHILGHYHYSRKKKLKTTK
uniref:Reverse transcriptase Ty1/copia-type domain-containing protein n=1 Tax=Physcomitrium patens TaxID=3218 RepID=A0A2K1IVU1_PHYPA|nr:hypothetical protein PHYPA_025337 [Physcomitrium patens]